MLGCFSIVFTFLYEVEFCLLFIVRQRREFYTKMQVSALVA